MKKTLVALLLIFSFMQSLARAQNLAPAGQVLLIKAGRLIDVRSGRVLENQGILVEGERIKSVGPFAQIKSRAPSSARLIDLSNATVLPGLSECHTHIL